MEYVISDRIVDAVKAMFSLTAQVLTICYDQVLHCAATPSG